MYSRLTSYLLCRQEGTKFKQEITWLYNTIEEEEVKQILGKPLGDGIENHRKVQWADYFLNSWHRKPESYKVWVCLVGVQVYAIGDT